MLSLAGWQLLRTLRGLPTSESSGSSPSAVQNANAIAVLPLQNISNDDDIDYLRFALADEVASVLTHNKGLDVRPTGMTRKYVNADVDPQQIGRELRVGNLVLGHYLRQQNRLLVTLQAVDVRTDRVTWQSIPITAEKSDFIALQQTLKTEIRSGLLPIFGSGTEYLATGTTPTSQEAYDLLSSQRSYPSRREAKSRGDCNATAFYSD